MLELSMHILDVAENALEAGATRIEISIEEDLEDDRLTIRVADNGRGMSEEFLQKVLDPFVTTRTTRRVGLGLPLFAAAAKWCNGDFEIRSKEGEGTVVTATFQHSHIDRAPLGDIKSTLLSIILFAPEVDLRYSHRVDGRVFEFDTAEIRRQLEDVPLSHPKVREWLAEFITKGEEGLGDKG